MLLDRKKSALILIDIQDKLAAAIENSGIITDNCINLAKSASRLGVPTLVTEQYPKGLGLTVSRLSDVIGNTAQIIDKNYFSCMRDERIKSYIESLEVEGRSQFVLAGMESHICVLQTAIDLVTEDIKVYVVADAIGSRKRINYEQALQRMQNAGVEIVTKEMVIYEWVEEADTQLFKDLLPSLK